MKEERGEADLKKRIRAAGDLLAETLKTNDIPPHVGLSAVVSVLLSLLYNSGASDESIEKLACHILSCADEGLFGDCTIGKE